MSDTPRLSGQLNDEADRLAGTMRTLFIETIAAERGYSDDLPALADAFAISAFPHIKTALAAVMEGA